MCVHSNARQASAIITPHWKELRSYTLRTLLLPHILLPSYPLSSYPAALVVPESVSDSSLAAMASQFLHNRFPVVTWKHSKTGATLLRSSSFVPSSIARKTVSSGPLVAYIQTPARQVVPSAGGGASEVQNVGGVGVYNEEVEKYLQTVLSISQSERREVGRLHVHACYMHAAFTVHV